MARDLDPALVEAVIEGIWGAELAAETNPAMRQMLSAGHYVGSMQHQDTTIVAIAAINAVDRFRAAAIRESVEEFSDVAMAYTNGACEYSDFDESRTALLKIVGAQEEPS